MPGERFDYSNERQRHEKFVGREALLARLDELLVDGGDDRWVVVTGGPGMGKSAVLSAWLARREAAGAAVPHHFIRRGAYDWDDPAQLVGSLVAQLDEHFPGVPEQDAGARMHPAARLARALSRVSAQALGPRSERLVVLIDGLDEYDPPAGALPGDPLAAFLPHALPRGVSFLCTSRPRHPYVSSLQARDGDFVPLDLDGSDSAADNDATVRTFWERDAGPLGLDAQFVEEAVVRAGGNVQHAVQLRRQVAGTPAHLRRVEDIPRGLGALIERTWERIAHDAVVVEGLGILCAAREALTLDELGAVAAWTAAAARRAFLRGAQEVLVDTQRPDGQREYRLHHDAIRAHITQAIGEVALRGHHGALARRLATWPAPAQAVARRYALRHALMHRAEAGDWEDAWRIAGDTSFLEAKGRELGAHEVEADVIRVAERCRAIGAATIGHRFSDLARALVRESHWLRAAPEATAAMLWNRLRRSGWSEHDLGNQLRVPVSAAFLRVRHIATRECPELVRDLVGHSGTVTACVVTPDGRRVVSASEDRTLKVWDLEIGRVLATLEGHTNLVTACAVTPDGRRVVSASEDQTLKVWDLETGRVLATVEGHARGVTACAVTPDGRRVVSASEDQTLKVWDLETGRVLVTLEGHTGGVRACAVTPDSRRVVSASHDRTLKVWDLESGRAHVTLGGHTGAVRACAVTPDGLRVVSASHDKTLKVWDLETGCVLATLEGHANWVRACAVTPDGLRVISASHDKTLKVWDLESGRVLATLEGHAGWVRACVVTPDGQRVVSASGDHTLKVWDLESGRARTVLEGHTDWVKACVMMPDNRRVVSASYDQTLKVWDLDSGRAHATLEGHDGWVRACAVIPDGRCVVLASADKTLKMWDLESGRVLATLEGHADWANACAVTPDGRRVVSASYDQTLKVWDVETGCVLASLEGHTHWVYACAVTPDGRRAVSASADQTLKVWDLESWRVLFTLEGHAGGVSACAVMPDGRRLVSASDDQMLKVWDLETGRVLATLEGHTGGVSACAVTPDGRRVVSASHDQTLKVWDLETYACLYTHRGDASYLAAAASSTGVVAGDSAGSIWFLDWPPSDRRATQLGIGEGENRSHALRPAQATPPSMPIIKKHTILFLAANPTGTDPLALGEEARAIQSELERSGCRDCFALETRWAVHPLDLLRELRKLKPTVVHFSGHGGPSPAGMGAQDGGPSRDVIADAATHDNDPQRGLFFQGPDGRAQVVTAQALDETFGAAGASVKLVVLNACYSDLQAEALRAHVDCVVGMSGTIVDDAARNFAIGFYGGLGERESVAAAFRQGRAAISLEGLRDSDRPQLRVRDGIDASKVILGLPVDPR
jgi:WD40 repeat protein